MSTILCPIWYNEEKNLIVKLSKRTDSQAYTLAAIQAFQLRHGKYTNPDKIQKLVIKK